MTRRLRQEAGGDPTLGPVTELANDPPDTDDRLAGAPTPRGNRPGRHPAEEQDKPPLDEFAARLGLRAEPDRPGQEGEQPVERAATPGEPAGLVERGLGRGLHVAQRTAADALRLGGRATGAASDALHRLSERVAPQHH